MAVRFLHAADLHLGLRITRFDEGACNRIGEARFEAIENLRLKALEHQVDFVLIAGDVFDDHSVSRVVADRALAALTAIPCPVYIIPGNHDPLTPGGVWDRAPWCEIAADTPIHVLREPRPIALPKRHVTLFPCPLRHRNSLADPTGWIAEHPRSAGDNHFRIGLAHGSLNLPHIPLPHDDHLIRPDVAEHYDLDYVALGHWHKPMRRKSADGAERVAYSGTHEPMRFPNAKASASTGWTAYSADRDAERFQDENRGTALLVTLDRPGAHPVLETLEVGRLRWLAEERDFAHLNIDDLITEYGNRDSRELTLLRLHLTGVVDPEILRRIHKEMQEIVVGRYCRGSSMDTDDLGIEPAPDQLSKIAGDGVLSRMLQRLRHDQQSPDPAVKHLADHATKLLYRIAWEELNP